MAGENAEDPRSGQPDEFLSKTKWQRFQVLIMGPVMNLALAVVLLAIVLAQGADVPAFLDQLPVVGGVEKGSPAERAGFKPGDRVLTVSGREVRNWEDFDVAIGSRPGRAVPVSVVRDSAEQSLTVTPDAEGKYEVGRIGVFPNVHPRVQSVRKGRTSGCCRPEARRRCHGRERRRRSSWRGTSPRPSARTRRSRSRSPSRAPASPSTSR